MNKGWECPRCGKVSAPHIDACGCIGDAPVAMPDWQPSGHVPPYRCSACRFSGIICMCDRRPIATCSDKPYSDWSVQHEPSVYAPMAGNDLRMNQSSNCGAR